MCYNIIWNVGPTSQYSIFFFHFFWYGYYKTLFMQYRLKHSFFSTWSLWSDIFIKSVEMIAMWGALFPFALVPFSPTLLLCSLIFSHKKNVQSPRSEPWTSWTALEELFDMLDRLIIPHSCLACRKIPNFKV
jgi:hypothetical protein